jgi:hypothetical protein
VEHLTERDAAEGRVDEVVHRGVVGLAEIFPRTAAERRDPGRFPEAQAIGAPGIEVVIALIRVADLIDDEIVEVPHPALLHVGPPRGGGDLRGNLAPREVGKLIEAVDDRRLRECLADTSIGTAFARAPLGAYRSGHVGRGLRTHTPRNRKHNEKGKDGSIHARKLTPITNLMPR